MSGLVFGRFVLRRFGRQSDVHRYSVSSYCRSPEVGIQFADVGTPPTGESTWESTRTRSKDV